MTQVPSKTEVQKGAGDTEARQTSMEVVVPVEEDEEDGEEKPSCCRQVGLAKMTPQQVADWQAGLLAGQPKLTAKDIRRHRLKYHIVICLELEEEGLPETAKYIRHLLQLNVDMRREAGPDSLLWRKPKLRDNKEYLDRLREGLAEAERAQQESKLGDQCEALLNLAVFFMTREEAWWWIAEQLFLWIVTVAEKHRADGGRMEAITRYIYGRFLLKQLEDVDAARRQLQTARGLSAGKEWDAKELLGPTQDVVYRETCGLLYKALLIVVRKIREENPAEALRLCSSALRRARDSQRKENEAEALYELALSYEQAGDNAMALEILTELLPIYKQLRDAQGLCNVYLEISICYKNLQDAPETFKHLELFLKTAEVNFLTDRKAEANRYLGEYHLNMGNCGRANTHFSTSFSLYFKLSMMEETEQVRCLQGIAAGHQLMPDFAQLLLDAQNSTKDMARLIKWKGLHRPFWQRNEAPFIREDDDESVETTPESTQEGSSVTGGSEQDRPYASDQISVSKVSVGQSSLGDVSEYSRAPNTDNT